MIFHALIQSDKETIICHNNVLNINDHLQLMIVGIISNFQCLKIKANMFKLVIIIINSFFIESLNLIFSLFLRLIILIKFISLCK